MTSNDKRTAIECIELLNGFDELAIKTKFGAEFDDLGGSMSMRALVFVDERRAGKSDSDAYKVAMSKPVKEIGEYFAEVDPMDEMNEDSPVSDSGKGDETAA